MNELQLILRGIAAGLAISAPVGPMNVLCISRTMAKGWKSGVVSGLGAATADTLYGSIAGFSIQFVISFLIREVMWIRFFGGLLLIGIGVAYYQKKPPAFSKDDESAKSDYTSALLLTLTNPTTVLSFLAVLAALHLAGHRPWWQTSFLVVGIFLGAMIWWILLAGLARRFRDRFNQNTVRWMNRIGGLAIGAFGVVTLILSRHR